MKIYNIFAAVNRVEIIDSKGRSYVNWNDNNKVEVHLQDKAKTLKIFINESRNADKTGETRRDN